MRLMGLDYGSKTVGVAVSDPLGLTAQGVETVWRKQENKLRQTMARIEELISEYQVERIVLGYPKNMNNTVGERAAVQPDQTHFRLFPQKELASQLGVKPPTVTVSIQRLEKIGIIVRKQDEKDQRISRIYLTEEGKAIINEGMRMVKEGEKQVLTGFSESELCLMKRFCIQIKENIEAMPAPEFSPEEMCMGHFCHKK